MENMQEQFINSLFDLTIENLIQWSKIRSYLDREYNRILENLLVKHVQYNYDYIGGDEINIESSYVSDIDGSFVYLFNYKTYPGELYRIFVQNYVDADIKEVRLPNNKLLEELVMQVKESINSQERTMEKVINIAKERLNTMGNESE